MPKAWQFRLAVALAVALPAVVMRMTGAHPSPTLSMLIFGTAILGAAFVLAWAAEAAQMDISAGLAIAVLAFIAVLPEYAVDLYFAYASGTEPQFEHYAAANMTGSNRLLLGLGWPVVVLVFVLGMRRRKVRVREVLLEPRRRVELGYLAVAGTYAFIIPFTRRLGLLDALVLLTLFALYLRTVAKEETSEPELVGVAACLAALPRHRRRPVVIALFLVAAGFILASAEPFAHALVDSGHHLGIDEFLLVQWLGPLASESPEFIIAGLLAFRGKGDAGLGTLLSSKVNQWTLLVGSIPIAHLLGGGGGWLVLDGRQAEEFLLTAAQTVLGLALLANLRFSLREAGALFVLFALQFAFPGVEARLVFTGLYLVLAAVLALRQVPDMRAIALVTMPAWARRRWTAEPAE
jgi:cation:H+ antiporter